MQGFRLSPPQARLWRRIASDGPGAYAARCRVEIVPAAGAVDRAALAGALSDLGERWEILRTGFRIPSGLGTPLQMVASRTELPLGAEGAPSPPADLSEPPLLLAALGERDGTALLDLALPSLLADDAGLDLLVRALAAAYGERRGETPERAEEEPLQYVDLSDWLCELLESPDTEAGRGYWGRQEIPALDAGELPLALAAGGFAPARMALDLPLGLGLSGIAGSLGVEVADLLAAGWAVLLSRLAERPAVALSVAFSGRKFAELEGALGTFSARIPVPFDLPGELSFGEAVTRVAAALLERRGFEEVFSEELLPGGSAPDLPFSFVRRAAPTEVEAGGARFAVRDREAVGDRFLFELRASVGEGEPALELGYDGGRVDSREAALLAERFLALLADAAARPEAPIEDLSIVGDSERALLAASGQGPARDFGGPRTLPALFAAQAARTPEALALESEEGHRTYAQLADESAAWAAELRERGVGRGSVVAVSLERSPEMVAMLLAVHRVGAAYLPIEPGLPEKRRDLMLEDARPALWVVGEGASPSGASGVPVFDLREERAGKPRASAGADAALGPLDLAYVIYTSGSTGRPKGVAVSHGAIANRLLWLESEFPLGSDGAVLQKTPASFDASVWEIFLPLAVGARMVLARPGAHGDVSYLARTVAEQRITVLQLVPSLLGPFLATEESAACRGVLKRLFSGGEALSAELAARAFDRLGIAPVNTYGPTESAIDATFFVSSGSGREGMEPIGTPIANDRIVLLDPRGNLSPALGRGEIAIGGAGLGRGYLGRPDLTAERFVPDSTSETPGARLYRTGDLGRWNGSGVLEYLGRIDGQVKIRGVRVELGEIEAALSRLPGVAEAAAALREDRPGDPRLAAYVVATEGGSIDASALSRRLSELLPDAMLPSDWEVLPALPRLPSGKVDRRALPAISGTAGRTGRGGQYQEPRTPTEQLVAERLMALLGVERLGVHDNVFDLGFHSLHATQLGSRLRRTFGVDVPLRSLFELPTVAELAARIDAGLRADPRLEAPALRRTERAESGEPLSFAQRRLWFVDQMQPGSPFYNIPVGLSLSGRLARPAFSAAIAEIVRRHEALRTTFAVVDSEPVQRVAPASARFPLREIDLSGLAEGRRLAEAARLARAEGLLPFDLSRGPLLRAALLRLDEATHHALFTLHHIVSDGWSTAVVTRELAALYSAFVAGRPSPLPEPELQYADYARWQREWLGGEAFGVLADYWRRELSDAPQRLDLPSDRPRPSVISSRGGTRARLMPAALHRRIEDLARAEGATPFMVVLAAGAALLGGLAGVDDLVIGTDLAGRNRGETEGTVGFFINQLALRCRIGGDPEFRQALARVRETTLAAYAHQDLPFDKLVETVNPERSRAYPPIFQAKVNLHNLPAADLALEDLAISPLSTPRVTSQIDWLLNLTPFPEGLQAWVEYSADLFDPPTIDRMLARYEALLEAIVETPALRLSELPLLDPAERTEILIARNASGADYGPELRLDRLFAIQAARTPERPAVALDGRSWTFAELEAAAARIARRLRREGVEIETPVALVVERSFEMVAGMLGILASGGCFVPVDPEHPAERIAEVIEAGSAYRVLAQKKYQPKVAASGRTVVIEEVLAEEAPAPSLAAVSPPKDAENLAYVMFTSGSTGKPKGVAVTHASVANRVLWSLVEHPLDVERDRFLQKTPIVFDASMWEYFTPLFSGALLVMAKPGEHQDTEALVRRVRKDAITVLQLVPSLVRPFLDEPEVEECRTLRRLFSGGEALAPDLVRRFQELFPDSEMYNLFGPTEAVIDCVSFRAEPGFARAAVPIGRPNGNLRTYVVSPALAPVPDGTPGELLIAGAGVARGYVGRPDLTAERFIPDPFAAEAGRPGDRAYRTGDLARWNSLGEIFYLGRSDRQVKVRGVRLELGEIEARLAEHPAVAQAVVVARDEPSGKRLVAYVVPRSAASGAVLAAESLAEDLRGFLAARLPAALVPSAIVPLDAFPRSPSGKLDLLALPVPRFEEEEATAPPRTATEEILAGFFAEVLERRQVGIADDFFALGGHSLSATRVISRARRAFGVELGVHQLFDAPTVAALAREVEAALGLAESEGPRAQAPPFARIPRDGSRLALSFAQQRLWFLEQLRPGTAMFNIPDAVRLRGDLDVSALRVALSGIVARHESLRTAFPALRGEPAPEILPPAPVELPRIDLAALPAEGKTRGGIRREECHRVLASEGDRPLDLAGGKLLRVRLLILGADDHVVAFTIHHIASDAWSAGVFVRELGLLYAAAAKGHPDPASTLSPLPFQYADFAAWQRRYLSGETLERELAWWRERLAGAPPILELPADRPRPARSSDRGITRPVLLPALVADDLRGVARSLGATPFMVLFAAWLVVLKRLTGRDDLVVGTDVANRNREETEGIVGFFINQLALRVDLSGDPSFSELVSRVRKVALGAYAHQDVPFDALVDALNLDRSVASAPLFQVKLFLENASRAAGEIPGGPRVEPLEVEIRVAKLDLVLAFWDRPEGFVGWVNFSTDLFDTPRVERWMRLLATVAGRAGRSPETPLSELLGTLTALEREEQAMDKKGLKELSFKSFKSVQPKAVSIVEAEVVRRSYLSPDQKLPLVLTPAVPDADLAEWAAGHKAEIQADLLAHGAILFRGFGIDNPEVLESFASTLCAELFNENGEHPRDSVTGNVYTPVFYPRDQRLLWHNENSFNWRWPRKIFFACAQPAEKGGETPLVDSRRVYEEIPEEIRTAFEEKGVLYQRTYSEGLGLPWQTVFQTEDVAEVEREAGETRVELSWRSGDRLRTRGARPAVIPHPVTGEKTWFNQGQHWHVACLDPETSESMRSLFPDDELPRHLFFGDGTPIPDEWMATILEVYDRLEVAFPWQKGDVVLLDNVLVAHGRNPFSGPRKILVAMGEMTSYDDVGGAR